MQRIAARDVAAWLGQEMAQPVVGDRRFVQCLVALERYWQPGTEVDEFFLQLELASRAAGAELLSAGFVSTEGVAVNGGALSGDQFIRLRLDQPLLLERVHVPKPWGQEIWYTGVEERGVCGLRGEGGTVPLPWLLDTLGKCLTAGQRQLVLLKILDPLAQEAWGDLYFELHEQKQEVYVVTHVDPEAWPDGEGRIRFGFDPAVLGRFDDEAAFRRAFRQSVAAYEGVRREIDAALDERRRQQGIELDAAVAPEQLVAWQQQLPEPLLARERQLRQAMEAYSLFKPLRVGDVVKVPCLTPHSLQHGVRTVEFQTPVYERKIVSFAQKVLTQGHWDTDDAVVLMNLQPAEEEPFAVIQHDAVVLVERIVDFDDFEVQRWRLQPHTRTALVSTAAYALVMPVDGSLQVGATGVDAEQACLVMSSLADVVVKNSGDTVLTALVAFPAAPTRR